MPSSLRIISYNIRFNNPKDGDNAWPYRKDQVASVLRFHCADLIGLQEALEDQVNDLAERLPQFNWVGVGREDGRTQGEFAAIFYRQARLELLEQSSFWLSETPQLPGHRGWDAGSIRVVTWGRFRDRLTGQSFFHFNTHLDNRGEQARREGARLLLAKIEAIAQAAPVIVTGDFNCAEDSEPYRILTGAAGRSLHDARYLSSHGHHGPTKTTNSNFAGLLEEKIDYIFVKNGVNVNQHGVLSDHWDGHYPSDHLPVLAEIVLDPQH
jgi:endonuclease/exonuclease/phosphatase family metal-dependent hydrolase